jgi:uncharacterized CHY-type Zn-finger protein
MRLVEIDDDSYYLESHTKSEIMEAYSNAPENAGKLKTYSIGYDISELEYGNEVKYYLRVSKTLTPEQFSKKLKETTMNDTIICENCESEFRVEELESEYEVSFCPYCGEALGGDEE